jgi:hypothetical protein
MREQNEVRQGAKKVYQKPGWEKEEMFVRFATKCCKTTCSARTGQNRSTKLS